jgi:hypothetical protein
MISTCRPWAAKWRSAQRTYWWRRAGGPRANGPEQAGDHHPALGNLQVERRVETFAAMLDQHILAGHAEVGGTVLHVGRDVGGADDDDAHVRLVGLAISLRLASGSSAGTIPARARSGSD